MVSKETLKGGEAGRHMDDTNHTYLLKGSKKLNDRLMVAVMNLWMTYIVNKERDSRGLSQLAIEVIDVISPTETAVDEVHLKISSTYIRQYLAELRSKTSAPAKE